MIRFLQKALSHVLAALLISMGSPMLAQAGVISTLEGLQSTQSQSNLDRINQALARDQVREHLRALGVNEAQLQARLARLTDSELQTLADRFNELPAGAGVVEVVAVLAVLVLAFSVILANMRIGF
ncbi:MAG TPA: PA2779 family protein [Steroidobacter sp.]|jgi:cytochrome c-type biogenesis protein CcmH/NrfG|nr:PA2779 family protein [Steroidobacter sp.]